MTWVSTNLRYLCAVRGCYLKTRAAQCDWVADSCPRGIKPSDIDIVLDNDGRFLFMEIKRQGETLPFGQRLLLQRLAARGHSVWVVRKMDDGSYRCEWVGKDTDEIPLTEDALKAALRAWWKP